MESPFVNDPFAMVWQAFKNLYPGKDCEVQWQPGIQDDGLSEQGYGFTEFCEDGSILVAVDANLRYQMLWRFWRMSWLMWPWALKMSMGPPGRRPSRPSSRSMAELLRKCSENRSQKNEICTYRK